MIIHVITNQFYEWDLEFEEMEGNGNMEHVSGGISDNEGGKKPCFSVKIF